MPNRYREAFADIPTHHISRRNSIRFLRAFIFYGEYGSDVRRTSPYSASCPMMAR